MYGFFVPGTKTSGLCLQVAVSGGLTVQYISSAHIFQHLHCNCANEVQPNLFCFLESFKGRKFGILFIYLFIFFFWRGWGGEMGGKGGLVIGPVFFDFLGSASDYSV